MDRLCPPNPVQRRVSLRDLNNRLPNTAESLPWRQPTEQQHLGHTFKVPAPTCSQCGNERGSCRCVTEYFERENPLFWAAVYAGAIALGVLLPHVFSGIR